MTPGETLVGTPYYNEKQKREYIASLDEPPIFDKNDTPEQRELRALMEQTKKALKERVAAGEDIGEILTETRVELQDLARYKSDINTMLNELKHKPDATIQDVDDFVKAANRMLEAKGIAPLRLGVVTRRMLQRYHETDKGKVK